MLRRGCHLNLEVYWNIMFELSIKFHLLNIYIITLIVFSLPIVGSDSRKPPLYPKSHASRTWVQPSSDIPVMNRVEAKPAFSDACLENNIQGIAEGLSWGLDPRKMVGQGCFFEIAKEIYEGDNKSLWFIGRPVSTLVAVISHASKQKHKIKE